MARKNINILQVNICGLSVRSTLALDCYINDRDADLVCLSETKGEPPFGHFRNYQYLASSPNTRNDRRGGVAILAKDNIRVSRIAPLERDNVDVVFASLAVGGTRLLVCSVYSPPCQSSQLCKVLEVIENANSLLNTYCCAGLVIIGDLNARHSRWGDKICNPAGLTVSDFLDKHSLMALSFIKENTFVCAEGGSVIDLVMISYGLSNLFVNQYLDTEIELFTGAPNRGHLPVWTTIALGHRPDECMRQVPDFGKTKWDKFSARLERDCEGLLRGAALSAETLWVQIKESMLHAKAESTPLKRRSSHSKPYWTPELSTLSLDVRTARRAFKYRSTFLNRERLDLAKEVFSYELNEAKKSFLSEQARALDSDTNFWKTFRRTFYPRTNNSMGDLRVDCNTVLVSDDNKANALYEEIFLGKHLERAVFDSSWKDKVDTDLHNHWSGATYMPEDDLNIPITLDEIYRAITKTKAANKSADNDGIHPLMLTQSGPSFRRILVCLFNQVLISGKWMWPTADVIFIRKVGKDASSLGGYRPISITSYVGKLLERVLERRIRVKAENDGLIPESQHGFRAGRSTGSYLFKLIGSIDHHVRLKHNVAGVFVDMQKAFDSVWHSGLLFKLKSLGINNLMLKLIGSFLDREVRLHVNNYVSEPKSCRVGLPQGSVLSPLLFALFIDDMLAGCKGLALQFADDSTLLSWSTTESELQLICQHDCDAISKWLAKWRMKANCAKSQLVCFRGNLDPLTLSGDTINPTNSSEVLGMVIDSHLSFKDQKAKADRILCTKWNMVLPFLYSGLSAQTARSILTKVILPKAFYNAHIWDTKDTLTVYKQLKSLLRAPFFPPIEMLNNLSGVLPMKLQHMANRLGLARQLVGINDDTLWSCDRSFLVTNTVHLIRKIKQMRLITREEVYKSDLTKSKIKSHINREWERQWTKFRLYHNGTGLIDIMDYPVKPLDLRLTPKLLGSICAAMTGHTRLQCHLYRIGMTFTPLCICLGGDESVFHHVFECALYKQSRLTTKPTTNNIDSIVEYLRDTGCKP